MTFDTLRGRLQRLKTLAEAVAADEHATTLQEILDDLDTDLEPSPDGHAAEVAPALLGTLRRRLTKASGSQKIR